MKIIFSILLIIFSLIYFTGCENRECDEKFIQKYDELIQLYQTIYKSDTTTDQLDIYKDKLLLFLNSYDGHKCFLDGEIIDPTNEIKDFIRDIKSKSFYIKAFSPYRVKIVYGKDNRQEVNEVSNPNYKIWAQTTAAQIAPSKIDDDFYLISQTIGESMNLCPDERFFNQINPARCSGFLVAQDILVTAGHCIEDQSDCDNYRWVFDFYKGVTKLDQKNIFRCEKIIVRELEYEGDGGFGSDYAVIKLDRPVNDRTFLKFRKAGKVNDSASLLVIGHPSGLPTKVTDQGKVRNNQYQDFFVTNLDTFGGNSGSPVIDSETGFVEGILVRGDTDYINGTGPNGQYCRKVNVCSEDGCGGESVTRITSIDWTDVGPFPIDGGWGEWSAWSQCQDGKKTRVRFCDNPRPQYGGQDCIGKSQEEKACVSITKDELYEGVFYDKSFDLFYGDHPLSFYSYFSGDYRISGRKFLGLCGLHITKKINSNRNWLVYKLVDCKLELNKLDEIFMSFVDLVEN